MAQVCGDSSYDYAWDRIHEAALRLVRKAADCWATGGPNALSSDAVVAVLLHVYLSEWPLFGGIQIETRDLTAWLERVTTAADEMQILRSSAGSEVVASCLQAVKAEIENATRQWVAGDPEAPATAHVLNAIEHVLFTHKLTRRPGSSKMPTSLADHETPQSTG